MTYCGDVITIIIQSEYHVFLELEWADRVFAKNELKHYVIENSQKTFQAQIAVERISFNSKFQGISLD